MASVSSRSNSLRLFLPLVPHFSCRTKFTAAASVKELVNKKVSVATNSHAKVTNVKQSKYVTEHLRGLNRQQAEADNEEDMFAFHDLTTLEAQMTSLKTKGFLRSYKSYLPPEDLSPRFMAACSEALKVPVSQDSLDTVTLDTNEDKFKVLKALHDEFGHVVHSSRLHEMKNLERVFLFYQSEICVLNPYEQLHRDKEADILPDNLVIKLDPIRFTGTGDHPLDKVTAWPRSSTLVTGLRAKEKYTSRLADFDPWEETDYQ